MLALTDSAVVALRRVLDDSQARGLRITAQARGCSGLGYNIALTDEGEADDEVIERDGVRLFVEAASQPLLDGAVVDFVETPEGAGLVFDNPNACCSCGKASC